MWSGQFGAGKAKIWGLWDYIDYEQDETGAYKYIEREVSTTEQIGDEWIKFTCPCDGSFKWMRFKKVVKPYHYSGDNFTGAIVTNVQTERKRRELSYITLDNFGDFKYNIKKNDNFLDKCKKNSEGLMLAECIPVTDNTPDTIEYAWLDCDIKMVSMGDRVTGKGGDTCFLEKGNVAYHLNRDGMLSDIKLSRDGLYTLETETIPTSSIEGAEFDPDYYVYTTSVSEVNSFTDESLGSSTKWIHQQFGSALHFYKKVTQTIEDFSGQEYIYQVLVPIGTFYLCDLKNVTDRANNIFDFKSTSSYYSTSAYEMIYPINNGLEDVPYLDRMEKCKASHTFAIDADRNMVMSQYKDLAQYEQTPLTVYIDPKTMKPYEPNSDCFHKQNGVEIKGNLRIIKQHEIYYKWTRSVAPKDMSLGYRITVDAEHFPGTYRLVGETYSRSRKDGKDQRLQFEIPLCKMSSDTNLTLEAAGDPTTFSMTMKVMRRDDGVMMRLTQYDVTSSKYGGICSGSTEVVPIDGVMPKIPDFGDG